MSGLVAFFLFGLGLLGASAYAHQTGVLYMRGRYERETHPLIFKGGMIFYAIAGVVSVVASIALFLKHST